MKRIQIYIEVICAMLLLLFVYTAISKLYDHNSFAYSLIRSPLLQRFAPPLSWGVPVAELVIAGLLFVPKTRPAGLKASLVVLSLFTLYLLYMVYLTDDRPCTCGGVISQMSWKQHIVFNLFFLLTSIAGIIQTRKHREAMKGTPP